MSACNICGSTKFLDMKKRLKVRCADCGSFERTRLLWLYIERSGVLKPGARVLHFAPETGLSARIRRIVGDDTYTAVDFDPSRYEAVPNVKRFDLTIDVEKLASASLDLIIHCHVLEHVPCTLAYPLFHLHRALKPDGIHACVIPMSPGRWDESFNMNLPEQERVSRFGQADHVRRLGSVDIGLSLGKIVRVDQYHKFDATRDFSVETLLGFNIPESHWRGLTMGTPLMLKKGDYLLQ